MPLFAVGGSTNVSVLKGYTDAVKASFKPDVWIAGNQTWIQNLTIEASLRLLRKENLSTTTFSYPLDLADVSTFIDKADLTANSAAMNGSTLAVQDQNEALKY